VASDKKKLEAENKRLRELVETAITLLDHFGHEANASAIRRTLEGR
jgi:hypothetical protein